MHYQAATEGPGALAYVNEAGYPDSTKGAEVLYRGTRGPSGWDSTQLSPAILAPNEQISPASGSGSVGWLSHDLSCGFAESFSPQTPDPAMNLVREYGGSTSTGSTPTTPTPRSPTWRPKTPTARRRRATTPSPPPRRTAARSPSKPDIATPVSPDPTQIRDSMNGTKARCETSASSPARAAKSLCRRRRGAALTRTP